MSEIAMVSSRKSRLELSAKKGDKSAKKALELSRNPGKFLSTVQIGITLIGILTGIYSGQKIEADFDNYLSTFEVLRPYSNTLAVTIIVIILTFFSLVLGELVPKRIGLTMPENISKAVAYPMFIISIIAAPFIWLLTFTTDLLVRLLNIRKTSDSNVTEEEIKAIIQEATITGEVQSIEQDIVENVFHMGDRKVGTLMTQRMDIDWLNANDPIDVVRHDIAVSAHKSFPVCNDKLDDFLGIIYPKDIMNCILNNEVLDLAKMARPALIFTESTSAFTALEKLRESNQHLALVIDEFGDIKGLLTMNDLVDSIVGDFEKQLHDKQEIIPREDGSYFVDASLPFPEFIRYFDIDISNNPPMIQINTLGGLIFYLGKKIPNVGATYNWNNFLFEIVDMDGSRIDKILVRKMN